MNNSPSSAVATDDVSSSSDVQLNENLNLNSNNSMLMNKFGINYETLRVPLIAITIIIVIICLIICVAILIRICIQRRRKLRREKNKDQLLSEQSGAPSTSKSSKTPIVNITTTNGKQGSTVQHVISNSTKPFYYDNLDDIPFIDESRPTSVIDIAQV